MKKIFLALSLTLALAAAPCRVQAQSAEVTKIMNYLLLAEQAGLDVPRYLMELSDQLAMASTTNYMNRDILEQGAAAAELYAHPLVCMNYAACQMKQHHYGTALHYLAIAWHQDKNNEMLATNIARCHFELGDDKLAEAFLDRALKLNPKYGLALQLKATILLRKGDNASQQAAVKYMFDSALDVWNGISVRQFNSLIAVMEQLYDKYRQADVPKHVEKYPTPLDGLEDYFVKIARAGRKKAEEPKPQSFTYPVPVTDIENDDEYTASLFRAALFGVEKSIYDIALGNDYMQKALSVRIPSVSSDYPTEYTGSIGGNTYLPDSRAFTITLLAWYYHQIKLLEANILSTQEQNRVLEPIEKRAKEGIAAVEKRMSEDQMIIDPNHLKAHGDQMYGYTKEYIRACVRTRIECWNKYMVPALKNYQVDIKTGLMYISDETAFKYIQTRYDKDIAEIYDQGEFMFFGGLQNQLDWGHYVSTEAETMLKWIGEKEQEYREELARTREQRFKDWKTNEDLKAIGMAGLNRQREPVPSMGVKILGVNYQVGIDKAGRIHTRIDTPTESDIKVYNPETGASSTTVLTAVKTDDKKNSLAHGRDPYKNLPKDFEKQVDLKDQLIASTGYFSRETSAMEGTQIVTDGRGNIVEASNIRETSRTVSVGTSSDALPSSAPLSLRSTFGVGGSYTVRTTTSSRYGSSVVSYSNRSSAAFSAGFGVGGFNILSFSGGVSEGGL